MNIVTYRVGNYPIPFLKNWIEKTGAKIYFYDETNLNFPPYKGWLAAASFTPLILEHHMKKHDEPFVFLDLDCYINKPIDDVFNKDFDIAITVPRTPKVNQYNAGVIFFKPSKDVKDFCRHWRHLLPYYCEKKPKPFPEQKALTDLIEHTWLNVLFLSGFEYNSRKIIYDDTQQWLEKSPEAKIIHFTKRRFETDYGKELLCKLQS